MQHDPGDIDPAPDAPAPPRKSTRLAVTWLRENSASWDRARFRAVIDAPLGPDLARTIAHRRAVLRLHAPAPLPGHYGKEAVTAQTLAIPPAYGTVLHNLARSIDARLIVEDGAGFGISSMYLAAAARQAMGGTLISFEIGDHAHHAAASVALIDPGARVVQGDFAGFSRHLSGSARIDMAFVDAVHDCDSILRSCRSLSGWMAPRSMIVVDDLSHSPSARDGFRTLMRMEQHDFVCLVNQRLGVLIRG